MRKKLTLEDKEFIKINYPNLGGIGCSQKLNVSRASVVNFAYSKGIKMNPDALTKSIQNSAIKTARKKINPDVFIQCQTPEAAYLLGLIWADGYVYHKKNSLGHSIRNLISLSIQENDFQDVLPSIMKTGKWNITYYKPALFKKCGKAAINSEELCRFLISCSYQSKSIDSACKILEYIPENLKKYWFRGFFDGDGCLYIRPKTKLGKIEISSSFDQKWDFMVRLCEELKIDYKIMRRVYKKGNRSSSFLIFKQHHISSFLNYIYESRALDEIGFSRKYKKYFEFLEIIRSKKAR